MTRPFISLLGNGTTAENSARAIVTEATASAEAKARHIVAEVIQRCSSEMVADTVVNASLPSQMLNELIAGLIEGHPGGPFQFGNDLTMTSIKLGITLRPNAITGCKKLAAISKRGSTRSSRTGWS
jgi:hypothetical protein